MSENLGFVPMCVQGFEAVPIQPVAAGVNGAYNSNITEGRGRVQYVDVISQSTLADSLNALVIFKLGTKQVLQSSLSSVNYLAKPANYRLIAVDVPGGQTFTLNVDNTNGAVDVGAVPHIYFENPYEDDEQLMCALERAHNGLHCKEYFTSFAPVAGRKQDGPILNVPTNLGDVLGFELFAEGANDDDVLISFIDLAFGGITCVDTASAALGLATCARPKRLFPFRVHEGQTFQYKALTNGAANVTIGVRLYFAGL